MFGLSRESGGGSHRLVSSPLASRLKRFLPATVYAVAVGWAKLELLSFKLFNSRVDVNSLIRMIDAGSGLYARKCPICGYEGVFILSTFGNPPVWNAKCPSCTSGDRNRLLFIALQKMGAINASSTIVHFGPERCLERWFRSQYKGYKTADLTRADVDLQINIENIDLESGSVDIVLCSHVLEHVDDRKALQELHRILKPAGVLFAMVPIVEGWEHTYEDPSIRDEKDRWLHYGRTDHLRFYGADFRDRVAAAGFQVSEYTAYGTEAVRYGLTRGEKVFLCTRQ